ncbi:MAG: hypothetical protein B9S33_09395 [Pedosphaera sp. Tous-C6FEB]|nr:MAG: hypothetical protein B9S33_09395 [Pedosphaera sp. Tous-C6FEB]
MPGGVGVAAEAEKHTPTKRTASIQSIGARLWSQTQPQHAWPFTEAAAGAAHTAALRVTLGLSQMRFMFVRVVRKFMARQGW